MGNLSYGCPCYELPVPDHQFAHAGYGNPKRTQYNAPMPPLSLPSGLEQKNRSGEPTSSQQQQFEAKYELLNVIGMGSTSQVRRCRERATRREFACKVIDKSKMKDLSHVMEQFENEIEVLFKLQQMRQHPHIIRLEDVFITPTSIFMIMELMRGGELFDYVVQRGTLSEGEASTMLRNITSAVAHMHAQGIIHRDLKPENLLLTREGPGAEIKIIDFGLSKMLPDAVTSDTQSFLGTRGYLAPEMLKRQAYSASVDVWALGVIAFILLCGCLPFDDDSARIASDEAARAKFQLRFPQWAQNITPEAKSFLGDLLNSDAKARITSTEALEHIWLQEAGEAGSPAKSPAMGALLASPKHIRNVPRTPTRNAPGAPPLRVPAGIEEESGIGGVKETGGTGESRGIGAEVTSGLRTRGGSF
mmetsp:Transcript_46558/g.93945  ORF Transcript_46558/g.93945 Transcript_46558/m.93945 type:complete len:418 (-) Transcript_46558:51-1304(-)